MSEKPKAGKKAGRQQRLQAALRENLKRRKAQARERAATVEPENDDPQGNSAVVPAKAGNCVVRRV